MVTSVRMDLTCTADSPASTTRHEPAVSPSMSGDVAACRHAPLAPVPVSLRRGSTVDRFRLAIAANFPVQPIAESLDFWLSETELPVDVAYAGDNQVFQELLDERSLLSTNRHGVNAVLVQLGHWDAQELAAAVAACAARTAVPHVVVCCPPRPGDERDYADQQRRLRAALPHDGQITVFTDDEVRARYPVARPYDAFHRTARQDREAPLPYTPEMFAALATVVARATHAWLTPRPKVIVTDADGTLWDGVVGEDGVDGLRIGPERREIHEILLAQRAAGRLLAICSANVEEDVLAALDKHPDARLRREHLTTHRINWLPKADNLAAIARELSLGLDSFVFLDDNPVECARVRAAHPEVLVVELPADPAAALSVLRHYWPLDITLATADDAQRAERYRVEQARRAAQAQAPSLAEFLRTLDLQVTVRPLTADDVARTAQLTQRTNQFNLTTRRRTVAEVETLVDCADPRCLVVTARDRFGDYGQVGVVITTHDTQTVRVDTFLLSCRVLGRGVEHRVLAELGRLALDAGRPWVELPFLPTERNQPALDFLRSLPASVDPAGASHPADPPVTRYRLLAEDAVRVRYQPPETAPAAPRPTEEVPPPRSGPAVTPAVRPELVYRIATALTTPEQVLAATEAHVAARRRAAGRPDPTAVTVPTDDPVEAAVARIWTELLDFPPTSVDDDFYALGGDSLLVVRFARRVLDEFGVELPLDDLFTEDFTIAETARRIRRHTGAASGERAGDLSPLSTQS